MLCREQYKEEEVIGLFVSGITVSIVSSSLGNRLAPEAGQRLTPITQMSNGSLFNHPLRNRTCNIATYRILTRFKSWNE